MKHCHISIMCNELIFLKHKLPMLYDNYNQLIFVDYNIIEKKNSCDGSIDFIENFKDTENKITLIKNFNPSMINIYNGVSMVEKQKMFAAASQYINDDIDVIWATDLDEFFEIELINEVEKLYSNDSHLISIDIPHKVFIYNEHNFLNKKDFYICPRITRHKKNKIYGHCNFNTYGKTVKYTKHYLYHFAFVGLSRCEFKLLKCYKSNIEHVKKWLELYKNELTNNKKYINISHPNPKLLLYTDRYMSTFPNYLDVSNLCKDLNKM